MHLTPEDFIDLAEGTQSEASFPHVSACDGCRRQLAAMRAAMAMATDADVPEPSPIFWDSLSARVRDAIATAAARPWWSVWTRPRVLMPLSAVAVLALVVALAPNLRLGSPGAGIGTAPSPIAVTSIAGEPAADSVDLAGDPLLMLVSDLSATIDWDSATAAGFAEQNSAEQAVTHMNGDELRALKQLLQAELTRPGA